MTEALDLQEDWACVMERLLDGDRRALLQITGMVASFLKRWNAFDFQNDWEDVIQEVVMATGTALRDGRIRERRAVLGYLKTTARNKYVDRVRQQLRCKEREALPWEEVVEKSLEPIHDEDQHVDEIRQSLDRAIAGLDAKHRDAVWAVHVEGRTYREAAASLGVPENTLKDRLKAGLAQLRRALDREEQASQRDPRRREGRR